MTISQGSYEDSSLRGAEEVDLPDEALAVPDGIAASARAKVRKGARADEKPDRLPRIR
jgi:hypothetical protein